MTEHNLTIGQLQARVNRARDTWEAAPEVLRSTLVSLHETPLVVRNIKDSETLGLVTWEGCGEGLYTTHPTEPERMWLREQVLREPAEALRMIELAHVVYENFYVHDIATKMPFRAVLLILEVKRPGYPVTVHPEDPQDADASSRTVVRLSTWQAIESLKDCHTEWNNLHPTLPEPFSAQIDLLQHNPFQHRYLGARVHLAQGAVSLHIVPPAEPWEAPDPDL